MCCRVRLGVEYCLDKDDLCIRPAGPPGGNTTSLEVWQLTSSGVSNNIGFPYHSGDAEVG